MKQDTSRWVAGSIERWTGLLLLVAVAGTAAYFMRLITFGQLVGFGLLPLIICNIPSVTFYGAERRKAIGGTWTLASLGAAITLLYGFASYSSSLRKLSLLSIALAWLITRASPGRWNPILKHPGVVLVIGEIVAGASDIATMMVALSTLILWLRLLAPMDPWRAIEILRNSLMIVLAIILIAFALRIKAPYTNSYRFDFESAQSRAGLTTFRWYLPLSTSWEPPAVLGVCLAVLSIALLRRGTTRSRALSAVGLVIGFVTVFGVNGRTAELALIFGGVLVWQSRRRPWVRVAALALATASLFVPLTYRLANYPLSALSSLASSSGFDTSAASFQSLHGRDFIWETASSVFFQSTGAHVAFGYGAHGYVTSGASAMYSPLLFGSALTGRGSYQVGLYDTHSTLLNLLLSQGLFGSILLVMGIVGVFRRVYRHREVLDWILLVSGFWTFGFMSSSGTACLPSRATYGLISLVFVLYPFVREQGTMTAEVQTRGA